MSLLALTASIGSLALLLVLPLVELLKWHLKLKGTWVLVVSVLVGTALGVLLAAGGLVGLERLPNFPVWVSGLIQGVLAGLVASGGKDTVTAFQLRGAEARAEALAKAGVPVAVAVTPLPEALVPVPPTEPSPDEWQPATLDALAGGR